MNRRDALRAGATAGAVAVAGCLGASEPGEVTLAESFEGGLDPWRTGAAIGPEVPLEEFEREAAVSDERAYEGDRSLRLFTEGDYDDGSVWVTRSVDVERGTAYDTRLTVQAWSESESFNILRNVLARVATTPPEAEEDFPDPGVTTSAFDDAPYGGLRQPLHLSEGWHRYACEWTTPELDADRLHVAVGVSVVWESDATHYVDDLRLTAEPR